jgi:hypothetical protein
MMMPASNASVMSAAACASTEKTLSAQGAELRLEGGVPSGSDRCILSLS